MGFTDSIFYLEYRKMAQFHAENSLLREFEVHTAHMRRQTQRRREQVQLRSVADHGHAASEANLAGDHHAPLGVQREDEVWRGCTNLRTLRTLLAKVDDRGFER